MTARLNKIIGNYIHLDQTGFIPNRDITDNTRKVLNVIQFSRYKNLKSSFILSIDFEKAFDSIETSYLKHIMKHMNFGPKFLNSIYTIYLAPSASIQTNNISSDNIKLSRGTRQGCPISPLLFAIAIEPLANAIRLNTKIEGINIKGKTVACGEWGEIRNMALKINRSNIFKCLILIWVVLPFSDFLFKFLVIGNAGTGKSCLLHQFIEKKFKDDSNHTIGVEFGSKIINVGGKYVKLQIWDTAGQERFRSVTRSYYRGAAGALLVYDITSRETYNALTNWLTDARMLASQNIVIILCGNKKDLDGDREVTFLEASRFAQENEMMFLETSALTGENVEEAFVQCARKILNKIESGELDPERMGSGIQYGDAALRQLRSPRRAQAQSVQECGC
ncbi:PREDICTED: ras-related protein Rab-4A [Gekko japonicus]|uniref:Ras-related protein Rab-4 n=1 Tax=Gekko japonicus TaxID=146911 RepID=A0ABM1LCV6_GEKJA|nr:PREDICTED: ras-related protein Rab-4A [Gekko japonicus]